MVHKRLSFWTILVSQQRRAFLAALVLVLLFSDCLINISHAQAGVLSQTANTQVSVHARLEIDAIHFDFPHVTSYLEITAPDSWKPFTALAGKTPGTDEYWQALLNLLLAVGLEYAPPREARLEGPAPADFGISKFIIHLEDRIESFDQKISVLPPFQVYPEDRNLVIVFAAESIHSEIPVNAEAQLRGMDADEVSDIDIEGRRGDFSFSDELVASWALPPEGYHEGGKFKIPFLYKTLEQLVKNSYRLPAGKVVHVKIHHVMEKFGSLPAGTSLQFNMEIEAPRDWPFVDGLRFNRNQKPLDPARLKLFLFTLQDWSPNELDGLVNGPVTLSNFSITDDSVHLSLSNSERGYIPLVLQSRGRQDLIAGSAIDVHENRTLLYLKSGSSQPYPWLSQTVELELRDLDILSVTPLPDMDDGKGHLSWQLPGGIPAGQNPEIRVEVNTQAVTPLQ
ncbi:MAG TPA: hypothetical protein VK249_23320, partial [Anaerolineales bacterium]|nr:hypothetical protein [Anaerolineales bacterium]